MATKLHCTSIDLDDWGEAVTCGSPADYFDDLINEPRCEYCRAPGSRRVTPWPDAGPTKEEVWVVIDRCTRKTYDFWQDLKKRESESGHEGAELTGDD